MEREQQGTMAQRVSPIKSDVHIAAYRLLATDLLTSDGFPHRDSVSEQ